MTIRPCLTRLMAALLVLSAIPAFAAAVAAKRVIVINAPLQVAAGTKLVVNVAASTDAVDGEKIGFFHGEYSIDSGKNWTGFVFDQKLGVSANRTVTVPVGAAGSQAKVRVRVAFRGGKAGDVDFNGGQIKWDGSWAKWDSPPARIVTINVK